MMEVWNEKAVEKSENALNQLKQLADFVIIGGWAVYLLTKAVKSLDIDIYMNYNEFFSAQAKLAEKGVYITFNSQLKKYSTKVEEIEIDIYTPDQCGLIVPCKDVFVNEWFEIVEGFKVIKVEPLILLKLSAESARKNTLKGFKDRVDILSLIIKSGVDKKVLTSLLDKYKVSKFKNRLLDVIRDSSDEYKYALQQSVIPGKLKKIKTGLIEKFRYL